MKRLLPMRRFEWDTNDMPLHLHIVDFTNKPSQNTYKTRKEKLIFFPTYNESQCDLNANKEKNCNQNQLRMVSFATVLGASSCGALTESRLFLFYFLIKGLKKNHNPSFFLCYFISLFWRKLNEKNLNIFIVIGKWCKRNPTAEPMRCKAFESEVTSHPIKGLLRANFYTNAENANNLCARELNVIIPH